MTPRAWYYVAVTTVGSLITRARRRADMVNSQFVTDAEVADYLTAAAAELYDDLLSSRGPERFVAETALTVPASASAVALGATYQRTVRVAWVYDGVSYPLEQEDYSGGDIPTSLEDWSPHRLPRYSIRHTFTSSVPSIYFTPPPSTPQSVTLSYIPVAPTLSTTADVVNNVHATNILGNDELLVVGAAIRMLDKQESPTTHLVQERERMVARIREYQDDERSLPRSVVDCGGWGTRQVRGSWWL